MEDTYTLLRAYTTQGDEKAFGECVARYLDLVYSAALRQVGGDASLAQDVTQTVFTDLARMAKFLPADVQLGGWLYRRSCFIAKTTVRTECRRKAREKASLAMNDLHTPQSDESWQHIAPVLDDALNRLNRTDRDVLVLRFFERQPLRAVGLTQGISENAARMRVERALDKLRLLLAKRGVTSTVAALAMLLANQAITAAPVGVAAGVTGAALAGAAVGVSGITSTLLHLMTLTKLKISIVGVLVAAGLTAPLILQQRQNTKLEHENLALRQCISQLTTIRDAVEKLPKINADSNDLEALRQQQLELLRLRGKIAAQRRQETELQQKLAESESQADLANFQLNMLREGSTTHWEDNNPKYTEFPEKYEIGKLQPVGCAKPIDLAQSVLYSVFHNQVDPYYDLADTPVVSINGTEVTMPVEKSAYQDRMYKERLAQMRQTWGGGAVTGIKGIQDNQHRLEARHGVPALAGGTAPKADFMKIFYRYRQCGSLAG
jgi:RNA polymerase sigma factor (sigma-70 family)